MGSGQLISMSNSCQLVVTLLGFYKKCVVLYNSTNTINVATIFILLKPSVHKWASYGWHSIISKLQIQGLKTLPQ